MANTINYQTYFNDNQWTVYEIQSDQEIAHFDVNEEAIEYATFLNMGGAFDGYTPQFIFNETEEPAYNIESFEIKFEDIED